MSGERTPTLTVPSTAPPRSGSWSSLVGLVAGRPQLRYDFQYASGFIHGSSMVFKLVITGDPCGGKTTAQLCCFSAMDGMLWFYPQFQGLEAVFHWRSLWREDHSSGMC